MKDHTKILLLLVLFAGMVTFAEFLYFQKSQSLNPDQPQNKNIQLKDETAQEAPELTGPKSSETTEIDTPETDQDSNHPLPERHLLDMPFYSQAPLGQWDTFHEDMCEEASLLNAALHLEDETLSTDKYESELHALQKIEKDIVGEWKSTTVAQTKKFADAYFEGKIKSKIVENPTVEDIESEVAAGHPVVVPLAGQDIGNPNFTPPGPVYHMLVVKGYDADDFITNDVGTRKGNSYAYKKNVIMKNIHDWNPQDIHLGAKRILILFK
jgi:hypothetical protein